MHFITLDSETDFDGWRKAARALVLNDVKPSDVTWTRARPTTPELFAPVDRNTAARSAAEHLQRLGQIRRTGAVRDPAPRPRAVCDPVSAAVAAAQPSRSAGGRDRSRCRAGRRRWQRPCTATSTRCTPSSASAKSAASGHRITSPGSSRSITSSKLAAPFFARRFADMPWSILTPGYLRALGRPCRLLHARRQQGRGADRRPSGGNLAALLRQHLQSGPAQGEGDADRDAEEILAEPAGGFAD